MALAALCIVSSAPLTGLLAAEGEPSLDRLIELNSAEILGAPDLKVGTDLGVKLEFKGGGRFDRLFQTRGAAGKGFISKLEEAKANTLGQKLVEHAEDVFSLIVLEGGTAASKFELADDFTIKFHAKIHVLVPAGALTVFVNQQDGRNYVSTSFFQDILVMDGGRKRRKLSSHRHFMPEPVKWFDKTSEKGVPVEIVYKKNKFSVFLTMKLEKKGEAERVEVVSQEGIEKPSSGKVVFSFNKLSLLIGNLSIEGKLSRSWAEAQIAKLRKDGKLKLKPDEKPDAGAGKLAAGEDKAAGKTKKESVDGPDPEAEEDL
jgi:hypothetical protein